MVYSHQILWRETEKQRGIQLNLLTNFWCLKDRIMVLKISFSSRHGVFEYSIVDIDKVGVFAFSLSLSWW